MKSNGKSRMRIQQSAFRSLSRLWFLTGILLFGSNSEAALPNAEQTETPRHIRVLLRVYASKAPDPSRYRTVEVDATDGTLNLPPGGMPKGTRLALVGWDQTDAALKENLHNVVLVGLPDDTWRLPSFDSGRAVPDIAIYDALEVPLAQRGLQLTVLFHPSETPVFHGERGQIKGAHSLRIDDLRPNDEGHPLLPFIVNMSRVTSSSARSWRLRTDRMRHQPVAAVCVLVHHPDYGAAAIDESVFLLGGATMRLPLVSSGDPAAVRAFSGWVLDRAAQKPLEHAVVRCDHVRTPGEGLIDAQRGIALTDTEGYFRYYPIPATNRADQRGTRVPPHSHAALNVSAGRSSDLLPEIQYACNDEPTIVALREGDAFHTFTFMRDGEKIPGEQISHVALYYTLPNQQQPRHALPRRYLTQGGKIPYGTYFASAGPDDLTFQPVEVHEQSPRNLIFRPVAGNAYRGRVLHGIADLPFAHAFVMAFTGTVSGRRLVDLTEQDWHVIDRFDEDQASQRLAFERLRKIYVFHNMTRSDERGAYRLALDPGRETHSLLFFAKDVVPFQVPARRFTSDQGAPIDVPDVKLFPAAFVTVTPHAEADHDTHVSVMPRWVVEPNDNPIWALEMISWVNWERQNQGQFAYDAWLKLDQANRIYVPAHAVLHLSLRAPYNSELCPLAIPTPICLDAGQEIDLGEWTLPAAQLYVVRVLDLDGQPVEGLPLRQERQPQHVGVAHNTDENGDAYFYARPDATISIHLTADDLGQPTLGDGQHHLTWTYELGGTQEHPPLFELSVPPDVLRLFRQKEVRTH